MDKIGLLSGSDRPRPTASSSEYSEVESLSSIFGDNMRAHVNDVDFN